MKYCPRCATELVPRFEGGRDRPACPACNYIFFGDFSIGVGGVVVRDGKVLLIRRGQNPGRGWWQIPGGYAEFDEPVAEAVAREVYEESGIRARVVDVLAFRHSVGGKGSIGGVSTNVYFIFRLEPIEGEGPEPQCDGEEIAATGYYSLDDIAGMEQVQELTKWAIQQALRSPEGLVPRQSATFPNSPHWTLFGPRA